MAESLTFWQSIKEYMLPYSQEQELHKTIAQLSDYIRGLSSDSPEKYQELLQCGVDIMNKYIDISSLSETALTALIAENGYSYITDLLELEVGHLRNIVYFLPLIHSLKGTIPGLIILLSCFCDAVEITEWWQDYQKTYDVGTTFNLKDGTGTITIIAKDVYANLYTIEYSSTGNIETVPYAQLISIIQRMKRYTFNLNVLRIKNMKLPKELPDRIYEFCSQYIYPLLADLEIQVAYTDGVTNKVFSYCEFTENLTTLADLNEALGILKSRLQADLRAVLSNYVEDSTDPLILHSTFTLPTGQLIDVLDRVDFAGTSTSDLCQVIVTSNDSELLHWVWGPANYLSQLGSVEYRGLLTVQTVQTEAPALVEAIQSVIQ